MGKLSRHRQDAAPPPPETPAFDAQVPPLVTGFGVQKVSTGKYLAVRITTLGGYEVLTPKRHGGDTGESKALAWQRAWEAAGEHAKRRDS